MIAKLGLLAGYIIMRLISMIYASKISAGFTTEQMENILADARKKNDANGITGILFFNRKYFLQCLEGPQDKVNDTYNDIVKDDRHSNLIILYYQEIKYRAFSEWHMGYVPESRLSAPILMKYSGSKIFNPYEMSGESAYFLLSELKDITGTA